MSKEMSMYQPEGLVSVKGTAMVSSRFVAERFGKEHRNVLQSIDNLDCSEEFRRLNFQQSYYKNEQNKKQPEVLMTRDGFTFMAMGFTGKKAAQFKEKYITAFNQMEAYIKDLSLAKMEFKPMTDAIQLAHDPIKFYHYTNEVDLLNRLVVGMSAKQFRTQIGIDDDTPIRPFMTAHQIMMMTRLQRTNTDLIQIGWDYEKRKSVLTEMVNKFNEPYKQLK